MNGAVRVRFKGTNVYTPVIGQDPRLLRGRATAWISTEAPFSVLNATSPYRAASIRPRMALWQPPELGPNALLGANLGLLRRRSRDKVRNDGIAESVISALVTNIVGIGIKPMFRTKDKDLNKALGELWLDWTNESDADEALDFYGLQALAVREVLEAGELFVRFRARLPEDGLTVPLQVQLLESEFCPLEKNQNFPSGARTVQGVAFDGQTRRRVGYWLWRDHPGDGLISPAGLIQQMSLVPAQDISHMRPIRRAGVVRGEPHLVRALIKMQELDKYDDAQLVRQQIAAMFAGLVETDPAFADRFFSGQQPEGTEQFFDLAPLTPGSMQMLNPGQKISFSNPPTVGSDYEAYMRHQERRIAASAGTLYEMATSDYSGVTDRGWRAAMLGFRRAMEMAQQHMVVFQLCAPTLIRFVMAVRLNRLVPIDKSISDREILRCLWVTDRWDYINPVQDIAAEQAEVLAGFTSRSNKVNERGEDIELLDDEIARDQAREREKNLIFTTNGANKTATAAGPARAPSTGPQPSAGPVEAAPPQ